MFNDKLTKSSSANDVQLLIHSTPEAYFDSVNCASAFRALSKYKSRDKDALDKVLTLSTDLAFSPRNLSTCLHAIASSRLMKKIPKSFVQKLESADLSLFNPQDTCNTLWSMVRLNQPIVTVVDRFSTIVANTPLKNYQPLTLSVTLWCFASLDVQNPALVTNLCNEIKTRNLATFNAQGLSNTIFALAKMNHFDQKELCSQICQELTLHRPLHDFQSLHLAHAMWALAWLRLDKNELLGFLDKASKELATRNVREFNTQTLASAFWALGNVGPANSSRNFQELLAREISRRGLEDFTYTALANILWAGAKLDLLDGMLVNEEMSRRHLRGFSTVDLINVLFALKNRLEFENPTLREKVSEELSRRNDAAKESSPLSQ